MAIKKQYRGYVGRPGILLAAKAIGCNYSHLRRVVLGQRHSPVLSKAWTHFQKTGEVLASAKGKYHNSPKAPAPSINLAAADNLSPVFFGILAKLGLHVVIVRFDSPELSGVGEQLGAELSSIGAGEFDSEAYIDGSIFNFFHVSKLGAAITQLKASIEKRDLLNITTILHAESATELRTWYPATADAVNLETKEEV